MLLFYKTYNEIDSFTSSLVSDLLLACGGV